MKCCLGYSWTVQQPLVICFLQWRQASVCVITSFLKKIHFQPLTCSVWQLQLTVQWFLLIVRRNHIELWRLYVPVHALVKQQTFQLWYSLAYILVIQVSIIIVCIYCGLSYLMTHQWVLSDICSWFKLLAVLWFESYTWSCQDFVCH